MNSISKEEKLKYGYEENKISATLEGITNNLNLINILKYLSIIKIKIINNILIIFEILYYLYFIKINLSLFLLNYFNCILFKINLRLTFINFTK